VDVRQTGELITKFIKLHRNLRGRKDRDGNELIKFRNACAGKPAGTV
jgi:hypothetical protein